MHWRGSSSWPGRRRRHGIKVLRWSHRRCFWSSDSRLKDRINGTLLWIRAIRLGFPPNCIPLSIALRTMRVCKGIPLTHFCPSHSWIGFDHIILKKEIKLKPFNETIPSPENILVIWCALSAPAQKFYNLFLKCRVSPNISCIGNWLSKKLKVVMPGVSHWLHRDFCWRDWGVSPQRSCVDATRIANLRTSRQTHLA
jgi:hypothetical protein